VRRAAHPLFGILFVYIVAEGLVCGAAMRGAGSAASEVLPRLALAYLGSLLLVVAAVHWLEDVEFRHVLAKLGASRPAWQWWAAAFVAALPAVIVWGWGAARGIPASASHGNGVAGAVLVMSAALWQETFYRGFVFRGLMRRHGFAASACIAAALLGIATVVEGIAGSPLHPGRSLTAAFLELPLSIALCQLFWMSGAALGPALLVRIALLGASLHAQSSWPMGAAALVLVLLGRFVFPRWVYATALILGCTLIPGRGATMSRNPAEPVIVASVPRPRVVATLRAGNEPGQLADVKCEEDSDCTHRSGPSPNCPHGSRGWIPPTDQLS